MSSVGSTFRVECVELGLVVVVVALLFLLHLHLVLIGTYNGLSVKDL